MQTIFGIIFLLAAAAGTYFVFLNMSVEYEYLFAEGGLSVDRILGKARRKRVFDCDKEDVQVVAPADSFVLKDYERQEPCRLIMGPRRICPGDTFPCRYVIPSTWSRNQPSRQRRHPWWRRDRSLHWIMEAPAR